jgi:hypothetical protein
MKSIIRHLLLDKLSSLVAEQGALLIMMSEYPKSTLAWAACNFRYAVNDVMISVLKALGQ